MSPKISEQYSKFLGGLLFTHGTAQTVFVRAVTPCDNIMGQVAALGRFHMNDSLPLERKIE